ncbi:phosphoribosylformylglycinamidine synthase-associated small membrane protein [Stappia albiluteola]|nr:phosphoribosylformylglycinamidine synthase-associated small membrane protein [Stappia albiluteola]
MDEDSARAIRFLLAKAAVFILLPAVLAALAALFLV